MAPRYGNYAEPQDTGVRKTYRVDGHVRSNFLIINQLWYLNLLNFFYFGGVITFTIFNLQDMEVQYFQAYIDGVDFVFIESPIFHHLDNNIYGGSRLVIIYFS